jgi:hypothetical protein
VTGTGKGAIGASIHKEDFFKCFHDLFLGMI